MPGLYTPPKFAQGPASAPRWLRRPCSVHPRTSRLSCGVPGPCPVFRPGTGRTALPINNKANFTSTIPALQAVNWPPWSALLNAGNQDPGFFLASETGTNLYGVAAAGAGKTASKLVFCVWNILPVLALALGALGQTCIITGILIHKFLPLVLMIH